MVQLSNVSRFYGEKGKEVRALDNVSLDIGRQDFVAVTGPSGCGKSTLLHLIAGLDQPDEGTVVVDGEPLHEAGEKRLTWFRRHRLGVVFQFFYLMPTMTVMENVALPLLLRGEGRALAEERSMDMLKLVRMEQRAGHFPRQLSGGEMQRVAVARAVVHSPALLVADEPTGNLDSLSAGKVVELFQEIASHFQATVILVTHSDQVAGVARSRVRMMDGKILETT